VPLGCYLNCVFLCVFILDACCHDRFLKFVGFIMKSGLVEWFGLGLVCAWVWVQTLLRTNLFFFLLNFINMNMKGFENPSSQ